MSGYRNLQLSFTKDKSSDLTKSEARGILRHKALNKQSDTPIHATHTYKTHSSYGYLHFFGRITKKKRTKSVKELNYGNLVDFWLRLVKNIGTYARKRMESSS